MIRAIVSTTWYVSIVTKTTCVFCKFYCYMKYLGKQVSTLLIFCKNI